MTSELRRALIESARRFDASLMAHRTVLGELGFGLSELDSVVYLRQDQRAIDAMHRRFTRVMREFDALREQSAELRRTAGHRRHWPLQRDRTA